MPTVPAPPQSRPQATPVRDRADACPGTLRLHSAADGALARVRLPGGVLTVEQAHTLADASARLGDGDLHLTSRGNVQLRGLDPAAAPELAQLLSTAGLLPAPRHERVRNIVVSPLSGLDGRGKADVRHWLTALDVTLCESEAAAALSGRFLFALDDGRGDMTPLAADVTVRAVPGDAALLRFGTHPRAVRVPARDAPRAALLAAEIFLTAAHRNGTSTGAAAWRVAELPGGADQLDRLTHEVAHRLNAPEAPYAEERSAPPTPGILTTHGKVAALSVVAPLGRLAGAQWRGLVDACREGAGEVRLTPWRGAVVPAPGLAPEAARTRLSALDALGLVTHSGSPWLGVTACVGRPGCAKSLADVRAEAADAVQAMPAHGPTPGPTPEPAPLPVHWSGCERRCGHPRGAWVDVVARPAEGGFAVSRGDGGDGDAPVTVTAGRTAADTLAAHRTPGIP